MLVQVTKFDEDDQCFGITEQEVVRVKIVIDIVKTDLSKQFKKWRSLQELGTSLKKLHSSEL